MKILTINSGSSSLKFSLFEMEKESVLAKGRIEKIGEGDSKAILHFSENKVEIAKNVENHLQAVTFLEEILAKYKILENFDSLDAVGHRVVHGGEEFKDSVIITKEVIEKIRSLFHLAPLHNPANLIGIEAIRKRSPSLLQVAVFDTSFHSTLPPHSFLYALKYELYERDKIKRYGFHGTSHRYVMKESAKYLKKPVNELNLITLHLGNGASATAIKGGKSVDTSMGFTPLEGLVMGTRSGDIDPGVIFYLNREKGMSIDQIDTLLNKESGIKGICKENDLREVERRVEEKDEKAELALDIFCYRIKKYIGAYTAVLGRVDAIVFTGGIGENSSLVREKVLDGMEVFKIFVDKEANKENKIKISLPESETDVLVIKTDEEIEIARECLKFLSE